MCKSIQNVKMVYTCLLHWLVQLTRNTRHILGDKGQIPEGIGHTIIQGHVQNRQSALGAVQEKLRTNDSKLKEVLIP